VGLTALSVAEYFRDEMNQDLLLFIDNIFRFTRRAPRSRRCWPHAFRPSRLPANLATELGELEERITSTKKGSITSVQAIYVPADDFTDPRRRPRFPTLTLRPTSHPGADRHRESTRPSIPSTRFREFWTPALSARSTMRSPAG